MKYETFETKRLFIRPTCEEDAEFILELLNSPKSIKYTGDRNVKTIESAKQYIKNNMLSQLKQLGFSNYTLITKTDNQKIGTCGLCNRKGLNGIDIGFALLPQYEKKGFALEAANRIKQAAFNNFNIKTLSAITGKNNLSSQKLLEKLEFNLIGKIQLPNIYEELLLYQLENTF